MGETFDKVSASMTYLALTKEELVARCVTKDAAIRVLLAQLEDAKANVIVLERRVAMGRNRI